MKADYCLILCIDYRIQQAFYEWISENHLLGVSDIVEVAGSSRDLVKPLKIEDREALLRNLDISVKLHKPRNIFIFDHQDCGAYAADNTIPGKQPLDADFEAHKEYSAQARHLLEGIYPHINIRSFYISLDHNVELI